MGISKPFLLLIFSLFVAYSHAYTFYVGGRDGWVLHPSESYSDWACRNRFQVNDTLVFKYKQGEDSVLVVSQQDFDQCNLSNPIQKMDTCDSVFKFDRSGPFFFVSGTDDRCKQGQKLIIVVMAVRPKIPVQPTPPSISPLAPPVPTPPVPPTFSPGPNSPFVQPPATSPVLSPSPLSIPPPMNSPVTSPPGVSPAPSPLSIPPPMNPPVTSPPGVNPAPSPFTVSPPAPSPTTTPASSPSTQPSAPGSPTQPSPPGTPVTATPPSAGTPNNPTGSAPELSDLRVSPVILAAAVLIMNYGFFN